MDNSLRACLPATAKQKVSIARLLNQIGVKDEDVVNYDIDNEAASHFIRQLYRKVTHLPSELDIQT